MAEKYFIINEAAADLIMAEDPIGMELQVWGFNGKIVGLARNFHHRSLEHTIAPVVMLYNSEQIFSAFIAVETKDSPSLISEIQKIYTKYEPEHTFEYSFVEDQTRASYEDVITIGRLGNLFSMVAIFVSCLGLFGLSAFITEQRTKETGIRKVLGASELSLLHLFSIDFIKLVLLAFVVGAPMAWISANYWLHDYAYRIDLGVRPFIIAGASALLISLVTVSYNTLKASLANPVDSLKYE